MRLSDASIDSDREAGAQPVVLVADGDAAIRRLIATTLGEHYRILEAEDGDAALDHLRVVAPHLVISDWTLAKTGGESLVRAVRQDGAARDAVAVLMLTTGADENVRGQMFEFGADDCMVKPFGPEELRARVRNLATVRRATALLRTKRENTEFLRVLAHELRTPLAAFRLQIEILTRGLTESMSPRQSAVISKLARSNSRFVEVIELLSHYVRIEAGHVVPRATELDLSTLTATVIEEFRERAAAKSVAIRLDEGSAGVSVVSDPELVKLMIAGLCDETIKRTNYEEIVANVENGPDGSARLEILDGGSPTRREDRAEPASHAGGSKQRLGIALVCRIAAVLGADVDLVGAGSRRCRVTFQPPAR